MRILIDNGHGEETPGKRSPIWKNNTQLLEWKYTREIAKEVVTKLRAKGIDARLLVPEDNDISLSVRCKRVNQVVSQVGRKNCLLVSIHLNASKDGKASGWEVHTFTGQSISDVYAKVLWEEAESLLKISTKMRGDWTDQDPDFDSNFSILRDTNCPAVLTENLFMDNEKDCKFLMTEIGKKTVVDIHVNGIEKIVNLI